MFYNFVFATPSTQIWIPSTDVQGFGVIHLGWDSYIKTKQDTVNHGFEGSVTNGGITVGVLPFKKLGLEIKTGPSGTNVADITLVLITNPDQPERKIALIFGGEATVNVALPEGQKPGYGGRNTHLTLLAAEKLDKLNR